MINFLYHNSLKEFSKLFSATSLLVKISVYLMLACLLRIYALFRIWEIILGLIFAKSY